MREFFTTSLGRFRLIAILEGISTALLFFVAMPLKYGLGLPEAVRITGSVHGILVVVYLLALVSVWITQRWSLGRGALGLVASIVPLMTFWFEHHVRDETPRETLKRGGA